MKFYFEKLVRENFRNGVMCACCDVRQAESSLARNQLNVIQFLNLNNQKGKPKNCCRNFFNGLLQNTGPGGPYTYVI